MTSHQAFALYLSTANTAQATFYKRLAQALSQVGK